MTSLITAADLHKTFPGAARRDPAVPVLGGVTLAVERGEMVAVVGPSGSGKSTLLYCLAGLEPIDGGSIRIAGEEITGMGRGRLAAVRRERMGFVFQQYNLIPSLSARENVALPLRLARGRVQRPAVDGALRAVGLADRGGHLPGKLSGGQQQRVAIARVLATRPDIVFADEPTGAIDTATGSDVLQLIRSAATGDRGVVVVTHDLEAAAIADRVLVLRDGVIHRELVGATPADVLDALSTAGASA